MVKVRSQFSHLLRLHQLFYEYYLSERRPAMKTKKYLLVLHQNGEEDPLDKKNDRLFFDEGEEEQLLAAHNQMSQASFDCDIWEYRQIKEGIWILVSVSPSEVGKDG